MGRGSSAARTPGCGKQHAQNERSEPDGPSPDAARFIVDLPHSTTGRERHLQRLTPLRPRQRICTMLAHYRTSVPHRCCGSRGAGRHRRERSVDSRGCEETAARRAGPTQARQSPLQSWARPPGARSFAVGRAVIARFSSAAREPWQPEADRLAAPAAARDCSLSLACGRREPCGATLYAGRHSARPPGALSLLWRSCIARPDRSEGTVAISGPTGPPLRAVGTRLRRRPASGSTPRNDRQGWDASRGGARPPAARSRLRVRIDPASASDRLTPGTWQAPRQPVRRLPPRPA